MFNFILLLFYQPELSLKVIAQLKTFHPLFEVQYFDFLLVIEISKKWLPNSYKGLYTFSHSRGRYLTYECLLYAKYCGRYFI